MIIHRYYEAKRRTEKSLDLLDKSPKGFFSNSDAMISSAITSCRW